MMSPKASRLADASGALVPDASRHRLFTSGGQAPGSGRGPAAPAARSGPPGVRDATALTSLPGQPPQAA